MHTHSMHILARTFNNSRANSRRLNGRVGHLDLDEPLGGSSRGHPALVKPLGGLTGLRCDEGVPCVDFVVCVSSPFSCSLTSWNSYITRHTLEYCLFKGAIQPDSLKGSVPPFYTVEYELSAGNACNRAFSP